MIRREAALFLKEVLQSTLTSATLLIHFCSSLPSTPTATTRIFLFPADSMKCLEISLIAVDSVEYLHNLSRDRNVLERSINVASN